MKETIILDALVKCAEIFLKDDMSIEVHGSRVCDKTNFDTHYALVGFNGSANLLVLISIDNQVLENIYKVFVDYEVSEEEKNEMMNELPDEVINTVAGLAIASFPKEYDDLVMSTPLAADKYTLDNIEKNNPSISKSVQTLYGEMICTIIKTDAKSNLEIR